MGFLGIFLILFTVVLGFSLASQAYADYLPHDAFMEMYQPKLDRVNEENLPPAKQIEIGIQDVDIVCHDNKIRILKVSAENHIACATPETAAKLVQRGWGLVNSDDEPYANIYSNSCGSVWEIHHRDGNVPSISKIIQTYRQTIDEFSSTSVVWASVRVVDHNDNILKIISGNAFRDEYVTIILDSLSEIEHVSDVEYRQGGCI